jgi:hypothetical protein
MKLALWITAGVLAAFAPAPPTRAAGWHGLVPLHSSRADVERLLGPPEPGAEAVYVTEGERVSVTYSRGACDYGWRVPAGTVVSLIVRPKVAPKVVDLKLVGNKYEKRRDVHVETLHYYVDRREGINYTVDEGGGVVTAIEYYPPLKDAALLCQPPAPAEGEQRRDADVRRLGAGRRRPRHSRATIKLSTLVNCCHSPRAASAVSCGAKFLTRRAMR